MKILGVAAALLMASSPAWAQFGTAGAPPTMSGWGRAGGGFHSGHSGGHSNAIFLGEPWFDGYNSSQSQPTYIVLPSQEASAPKLVEPAKPIIPLMIERQGDHFVRVTDGHQDEASARRVDERTTADSELAPVRLIFRDGHSEQIRDYSIIGGRLYTSADYLQSGAWMRTIQLSALDLSATVEANRNTTARFILPSGPNVVVVRP
ncbi:MAG TPA: hypothetical protein VH088_09060 [Terriglobales bacterium]|nr:hypothetical protein [Terriglobales bacterium]